ncbi:MAG: hypothetical protein E2O86_05705 [Bacteroidetes bacterium]|nr:MAG: hypothetical protein E2O86_05705 [Bacteroidota bacterium]
MKTLNYIIICMLLAIITMSCSQENEVTGEKSSLIFTGISTLKDQVPNSLLDESMEGIYHGVVASGSTLSRGKIWVNVANNSNYNALIELADGIFFEFSLNPTSLSEAVNMTIFEFVSNEGHFTLDLSNTGEPEIANIVLLNESFFGRVVKSMSNNMASSATATFSENGNPSFSGTWNLIADGSILNPNGNNGDGITSLLITINGDLFEDFTFDSFNAAACLGNSDYFPTLYSYGVPDFTICDYQTTSFAGGTAKWNLSYDQSGQGYVNYFLCENTTAGTFTWTSSDGTIYKEGEILID